LFSLHALKTKPNYFLFINCVNIMCYLFIIFINTYEYIEDENGPTILKSVVVKAIKDMQKRRPQETTTYQSIYLRNWETMD
jgi:hypothetical protein